MAVVVGAETCHADIGATADQVQLTKQVRQVAVQNSHASNVLWVRVFTGDDATAALARATATNAAAAADENFRVGPGQRKVVYKGPRGRHVALSVIASGATTPASFEGTQFQD